MSKDAKKLRKACRKELRSLWHDLDHAVRSALNGTWSMGCDDVTHRIKRLTRLVGPTPWEAIQITLLESGVYQRIHAELGIEVTVDMDQVAEVRERIEDRRRRVTQ